jgi:hypothetical protein
MRQDLDQRPDPLWKEHVGRSRLQASVIVIGVIAAYVAIAIIHPQGACSLPGTGPCSGEPIIAAAVKPIAPLSLSACVAEMRRWGRGGATAADACRQGRRQVWFRAVIRNTSGDQTAVLCDVQAFRGSGKRIGRTIPLPVYIVQEPGVMWLNAHQTRTVEWFFDPHDAPKGIVGAVRFVARCRRNPRPPI